MAEKDYSKYFKKPNLKEAAKRGKERVKVINFDLPETMEKIGKGKKFLIDTFGCQMNVHDTEVMSGILQNMGFNHTKNEEEADIIILNTCAIRENAENKVFGKIGALKHLKRENPDLILGVCGCMSQEEKIVNTLLEKYQHVDLIFGTHNIHRLPEYLRDAYLNKERIVEVWSQEGDIVEHMPKRREGSVKAWVNITYGCDEFCTYCIVPFTRGKERSRLPKDIINEVRELAELGYKEVTLLGQNVNSYGKDFKDEKYGFGDLLNDLNKVDIPRVRFTTSHPKDFDDKSVAALGKGGNLVEHIHLPVQSGNTDVLKRMNRKYTREDYLELVRKLKETIPNVSLTTDIIVGFPNETDEQFEDTLSLVKEVGYEGAFTFIYSPREGTPAAKMKDNVPMEVKKERLQRLNKLVNEGYRKGHEQYKGQVVEVLCEGTSKNDDSILAGYTRTNKLVNFTGDTAAIGNLVKVKVTEARTWHLLGEQVYE
ncbi:tRNA (N6-isopentenyl adenosine(37)-C2)-methylthiotransferase MiaB [Haloplasma contractile]|uniref:tRNA-2-methylthio-N(6)-dimethylallyladenosine synthase n=1 Tax=Haloplasma contractile SSD-17B TaxID=1033810 RepID=U2EGB8_9MOLU|nr:tRNA (N6-isopentenyl adenosine(37)-C2)-methylthiotransferase MiaB [Haloplasma contractile]ERJ13661.1 adenosine tRNA methylthiotransferase MiaB protein [Haloplasma contractile SSD-17B]